MAEQLKAVDGGKADDARGGGVGRCHSCAVEQWQLGGLISRRPVVRIHPAQPKHRASAHPAPQGQAAGHQGAIRFMSSVKGTNGRNKFECRPECRIQS